MNAIELEQVRIALAGAQTTIQLRCQQLMLAAGLTSSDAKSIGRALATSHAAWQEVNRLIESAAKLGAWPRPEPAIDRARAS